MKMKAKNIVLSLLGSAALVSLSLGVGLSVESPVEAQAAEQTTIFECPGASIRMNKQDGLNGIRFPMFMDDTTFNTLTGNATIQNEDVTFGTLIIPTDKLTGTLDVNTALAKNLVTYGYNEEDEFVNVWTDCTDKDYPDCMQGYAYIHSIPDTSLDRNLTAVGYYTVDGGASYVYTKPIERHVSYVADAAIKSGDYSEAQMTKLEDFLANYTLTFDVNSQISTQQVKYGKTFNFPTATMETPAGSTLDWYEVGSDAKVVSNGTLTATKSTTYKLQAVENVQYTTTIYNKENIFKGDPSVTYKDGYYYSIHEDSKGRLWILKTTSLEEILEGGSSGWGHSGKPVCVYEPKEGDELGAEVWAPELTYIQGKWYIYVCGVAYGTVRGDGNNMKMFVLECESQDPTGTWKDPVRLYPKGFNDYYTIDGHAFEYKGQLYYVFSGQKEGWLGSLGEDRRPLLYITKMSSPTECTNDTAVCISKGSDLEEGPCTIVDGDDVYLMYSAGTWNGGDYNNSNDYHLEYYKLSGANLLSSNSWSEMGVCLEHDASKDIYAVGHNHIFKNADGSLWTSYHGIVGTADAGTDAYLAKRRCMVQPISIESGRLNFGGIQDTVVITDKAGLQYNNAEKTEYLVDGYGSARLWKNDGKTFTVSTTIQRVSNEKDYCAGVTLYERHGDGNLSKLLIGVEEEGNIFFCKDYLRIPLYFKYADKTWQWGESTVANLTVTYTAGASTANSTITVEIANGNYSKSKTTTYTLDDINALVSDAIEGKTADFNLHFTGDFEIGLGGNRGVCSFTNVSFEFETFNVSFIGAYGDTTNVKYAGGATLEFPEVTAREGYQFLGWAERIGEDEYTEPGNITDLRVTSDREFVAMFNAVGPTYEKPATSEAIYWAAEHTVENGVMSLSGGYLLEDATVANGDAFVVEATFTIAGDEVGFVVDSDKEARYTSFVYKPSVNTFMFYTDDWNYHVTGIVNVANAYAKGETVRMTLVYNNKSYTIFMDGKLACVINENDTCNDTYSSVKGKYSIKEMIGTGETVYVGLLSTNNASTYTDWWYSAEVEVVEEYVGTYVAEVEDFAADVTDGYNYGFEATATFKAPKASESMIRMGFDFTTGEQASFLRLVCIANWSGQYRIGIQGFDNNHTETSAWVRYDMSELNLSDTVTLKVVYDGNRNMKVFINGVEKSDAMWNTTTVKSVSALSFCGTSTANDRATLTITPYADRTEITGFDFVQGEMFTDKIGIGENVHWAGEHSMSGGALLLKGGYLLEDATVANGDAFVVEATFTIAGDEVGFVVDSDKEARYTSFVYKPSANTFMFYTDDWNYHVTGIVNVADAYAKGDTVRMTLVYNNKSYTIFMDGKLACVINENDTCNDTYSSVKGKYSIKEMIGTGETLYVGLLSTNNASTYTDWWYSTDAEVVEEYVGTYVAEVEDFAADVTDGYNYGFEATATFKAPKASESMIRMGFDFTTGEQASFLRLVCIANWSGQYRIGIQGFDNNHTETSAWVRYDMSELNLSDTVTLKVVYDGNRNMKVFINGVEKSDAMWNTTTVKSVSALSFCGTSTANDRATLTITPYADRTEITGFDFVQGEMFVPALTEATIENFSNEFIAVGSDFNPEFEVSAKFNAHSSTASKKLMGFEFSTGDGSKLIFAYAINWNNTSHAKIGFKALDASGKESGSRWYEIDTLIDLSKVNTIKVVYDGYFDFFVYVTPEGGAEYQIKPTNGNNGRFDLGWNINGSNGHASAKPFTFCGTSNLNARGTLTVKPFTDYATDITYSDFAYTANEFKNGVSVVKNFVCDVSGTYSDSMDAASNNNPHFEVSATFDANSSTAQKKLMGFEFTTGEGTRLVFAYGINWNGSARMGFKALDADGNELAGRWYNVNTTLDLSKANTIRVVYDGNRNFYVYVTPEGGSEFQITATDGRKGSQFTLGWGLGADGSKALPLSYAGTSTLDNRMTLIVKPFTDYPTDIEWSDFTCTITGGYQG